MVFIKLAEHDFEMNRVQSHEAAGIRRLISLPAVLSSRAKQSVGEKLCHDAADDGQVEEDVGVAHAVDLREEVGSAA